MPDLPRAQRAESPGRNPGRVERIGERMQRCIDRFIGELECAVVAGERRLGAAIDQCLHGLGGVHVLLAHEPARLVRPDRQDCEPGWSVTVAHAAEMSAVALAGIGDEIERSAWRLDHE